jgi:hypothetical protein
MARTTSNLVLHNVTKVEIGPIISSENNRWQHLAIFQTIDNKEVYTQISMFTESDTIPIHMVDNINEYSTTK